MDEILAIGILWQLTGFIIPGLAFSTAQLAKRSKGAALMRIGSILLILSAAFSIWVQTFFISNYSVHEYTWVFSISSIINMLAWVLYLVGVRQLVKSKAEEPKQGLFL